MAIMRWIGRNVVRFRYVIVVAWVVATVLCVHFLPSLGSVSNSDNSAFLPSSAPSAHAAQLETPFQSSGGSTATLVASRANGPLTAADEAAITSVEQKVASVAHVSGVRDQGVSDDGQARKALITLDITTSNGAGHTVVSDLRAQAPASALPAGLTINFTGQLPSNVDNQLASKQAQRLTQLLSNLAILIMLLIVYRALLAPLITLAPAVVALAVASPLIAEASTVGLPVSSFTQTILTVLVLGAGTDYGLFLTLRVHEELKRGRTAREAVEIAVERVGESIIFSAGTVIGALLCLLLAVFGVYHGLGPSLAIGIGVMLLAGLTLLPALLAIFGKAAFWPQKFVVAQDERPGAWGRLSAQIVARPAMTLALGVVVFGALALVAFRYAPAGFAGSTTGPTGSDSAAGTTALDTHFSAAASQPTVVLFHFPTSVWSNLTVAQQAEDQIAASSVFQSVSGPFNPNGATITPQQLATLYAELGAPADLPPTEPSAIAAHIPARAYNAYRATAQFISPDGQTMQLYTTLTAGDPSSTAALQAIPSVRSAVQSVARQVGANDWGVNGKAAVAYDVSATSDSDLARVLPIVLLLIAILLALVMRSLIAPLYLVASVALSYATSLGIAVLIFMVIGGAAGIDFVLPFLMFVFLMALGSDYNILMMSRIREEARHMKLRDAIAHALNATGTTITSAGLILAATFGVAGLFGATDQLRQLGTSIAIGVLLDTFLVRTLLVPSLVALLGRWNWWPSPLFRQQAPADDTHATTAVDAVAAGERGA